MLIKNLKKENEAIELKTTFLSLFLAMEPFIVSARKYRPAHFKDVVGQQSITNTLENAIKSNHLAQALLFTGPRGVGKTTCARILAKKINQNGEESLDEDYAFNIFELDAASNNSVDDIRNLIDQVRIPPQVGNYKVYIIDEVHMLSSSAFNAFLKTLEEPPKHAIFILATTEKHKIIPTILSRCQIFDFKRITVLDIKNHLSRVANSEGIETEDDALHIIAQKADGALRDALSIFDRVISFSGKKITRQDVTQNLNILDYTSFFEITNLLLKNDIPNVLLNYNSILSKGFDGHHFIMGLASHFRDLLVCKNKETISLLEVGDQIKQMYLEQSQKTDTSFLFKAIEFSNSCELKYKQSQNQRLLVELCLLQLASITFTSEISEEKKKPENFIIPPSYFNTQNKETTTIETSKEAKKTIVSKTVEEHSEKYESNIQKKNIEPSIINNNQEIKKVSALSLKSIQKKQQLKNELSKRQKIKKNLPTNLFSEEDLKKVWTQYTQLLKKQGKYNLHSHLTMVEPNLKGTTVYLEYPNSTIKVEVERAKYELLSYLKKSLENHTIDLDIKVNEAVAKKYAYTTQEKYEKLKELNPNIELLRKEFDLEI